MNETRAWWNVIKLRERQREYREREQNAATMDWTEFQESLLEEGYTQRPYNSVDGRTIRKANCPDCGKKHLFPKAFTNSNNEYALYQVCSWCDYYGEV